MGDVPFRFADEPTRSEVVIERLASATAVVLDALSVLLTGDRGGKVRRPILFLIVAAAIGLQPLTMLTILGLGAIMLLALSDQVTDVE